MCSQVRAEEVTREEGGRRVEVAAGRRLLAVYATLAARGEHLLRGLLDGQPPRQWRHYPEDDAIDGGSRYQWFYHSHSPEDRPAGIEHGHFHLFFRGRLGAGRLRSPVEKAFAALTGRPSARPGTRHLLGVGLDAKGVPISLFTVNGWVTGDLMLSAAGTARLLARMRLATGHPEIDAVLESLVALCRGEIRRLLAERDAALSAGPARGVLEDRRLEVLSEIAIDLDR